MGSRKRNSAEKIKEAKKDLAFAKLKIKTKATLIVVIIFFIIPPFT